MSKSLLTELGTIFKACTGVDDISMLKKDIKKRVGKLIYHKTYTADDLIDVLKSLGMKKGQVVCIHSSMKEFYNYRGTAEELISKILDYLTPEGTLLMPAFVDYDIQASDQYIFDKKRDKTAAGFLAETFRKYPGVLRSINVRHSICAIGKYAKELTDGHQNCRVYWDEDSPWYKMTRLDALVVDLGMPKNYIGTFDHCVEAILYKEHPYWKQFFNLQKTFRYYNDNGEICSYTCLDGDIEQRSHESTLISYFDISMHRTYRLSNLWVSVYNSKICLDKMIELGRKGITMYYVPSPLKYKF